jgi:hypothetical protein
MTVVLFIFIQINTILEYSLIMYFQAGVLRFLDSSAVITMRLCYNLKQVFQTHRQIAGFLVKRKERKKVNQKLHGVISRPEDKRFIFLVQILFL